ncbi:phenylacetate--CoA ligase family protein [Simiduia litorea]|uniref:phenylacetate--CoA ligase family protein n=1 Tax=Simiduia litorea TaxID=1435348 RepID=UPI0036F2B9DE
MLGANWIGKLAYYLWDTKEGGVRLAELKRLQALESKSPSELAQFQQQRLSELIRHAWDSSPWYRAQLVAAGFTSGDNFSLNDLAKLPVTTKADIRDNTDKFISSQVDKNTLNRAKTGGSTGVSLNLYFDERCQQLRNAAQMYADTMANWRIGHRVAAVWGNPPIAKTFKQKLRAALLERTIYLDTMDLNPSSMQAFVAQWQTYQPEVIFGHAHSIYIFARFILANDIRTVRPKGIVATSMMLLEHERSAIEAAFGCQVTNRYGCEEVGLIAVECEQHQGMHINAPHIILECLDANDQPVADGQAGKLVITDLNNFAMPLIRYRVEDVGVISQRQCSCGRGLPLLERLEGRVADFLKKPDGGQVAGISLVERTLTKVPGVEQMQLVQETLDELKILRVKGKDFTDTTDDALITEFRQVFPTSVTLTIIDVNRIPQEASGKYRFSICRL